jgi:hypothetical protein
LVEVEYTTRCIYIYIHIYIYGYIYCDFYHFRRICVIERSKWFQVMHHSFDHVTSCNLFIHLLVLLKVPLYWFRIFILLNSILSIEIWHLTSMFFKDWQNVKIPMWNMLIKYYDFFNIMFRFYSIIIFEFSVGQLYLTI